MPEQLSFLAERPPEWLERLRHGVRAWADRGVYFGGSSWKYPGWLGQIYRRDRYLVRGKFSQALFDRACLAEYAEWFPTVCGDFSFYDFYPEKFWANLFQQVPPTFRFGFKVPEAITSPVLRQEDGSTPANPNFLNADLVREQFIDRLAPYARQVGYIVFEFPQFHGATPESNRRFLDQLAAFLGKLPRELPCAVEIRTESLLGPDYLAILRQHRVAHAFNSWTRMPSVGDQLRLDAFTADFTVARLLLRPGRAYAAAVKDFQPYDSIKDPFPEGYRDAAELVRKAEGKKLRAVYLATNNRFAGNSPQTIHAILTELDRA